MSGRTLLRRVGTAFALVAPPYVIFVHPTLELIRRNDQYFVGDYSVGWQLYLAGFMLFAAGVLLWLRRKTSVLRALLGTYLLSAGGWFVYTLVGQFAGPRWLLLAALGAGLLIGGVHLRDRVEDAMGMLGTAGGVLIIGLTLSVVISGSVDATGTDASDPVADETEEVAGGGMGDRSHLPNVYHLIFDEFQTEMFEVALTEDTRRALDGFVHFPEASTPYGRTEMALASMFSPRSYAYDQPLSDYIERAFADERGLIGRLRAEGYRTTGWLHGVDFFGGFSPFDLTYLHREVAGAVPAVGERATLVRSIWLHTHLPRVVATPLMPDRHLRQLAGNALLPDEAPPQSVGSFWELIDAEPRQSGHGRYVMAHFILPHFPYVLNGDCEVVAAGTTPREQASCALRLVDVFVGVLHDLGRYDDSLIIVQSDHGARYELRDGELVNLEGEGYYSDEWSLARSRPLLLVKPPGSPRGEGLTVSPAPATLEDVLPTVADALGWDHEPADGRTSLLSESFPDRAARYYHFYDKEPAAIIDGDLQRFVIRPGGAEFDKALPVPSR